MSRIQELFEADTIAHNLGVVLVSAVGASVELRVEIDDRHVGWHGRCHGGVLFTLADIAMSYVGNRGEGTAFATHASVAFLAGAEAGDVLEIECHEIARNGRTAICDATIRCGDAVVATFRGSTLQVGPARA